MHAIELCEPQKFRRIEIDAPPPPGPGQVTVATHRMGICGTDVSCYLGKFPFFDYPRIPGHELGVQVVAVGPEVSNVSVGDRCSVEPYLNCGRCYPCRRGAGNCCTELKVIGVMQNGGLCERFNLPANKLHVSKQLTFDQLALVETLAIGCHASARGGAVTGDHVLIIGAGPIGLATLEFVRLTGAEVTVMDMAESRLQFVREHYDVSHTVLFEGNGSEIAAIAEITGGDKYALVIDATGNHHSMSGALQYVAPTGTLVYVGITTQNLTFAHPAMHRPEMTIKAARNALPDDFVQIIRLIETGVINTDPWITHRTTFDDVMNDFESFTRPETGVLKAIIEVV